MFRFTPLARTGKGSARILALLMLPFMAACGSTSAPASSAPAAASAAAAKPSTAAPASTAAKPSAAASTAAKPSAAASTAAKPSAAASGAAKPAASAGASADLQSLAAAAKQEGKLTIGLSAAPPLQDVIFPAFTKQYGVAIDTIVGGGGDVLNRMITEKAAGQHNIDIFNGANTTSPAAYKAGLYTALKPSVVIPDVNNSSLWLGGKPLYMDPNQDTIAVLDRQVRYFFHVNPQVIDPTSIKTAQDLLDPKYKGKIAAFDPTISGAGQGVATVIQKVMGNDYVKQLYIGQEVKLTTEQRTLGDWVAHGTYPIVIGLPADERANVLGSGLPVARVHLTGQLTDSLTSVLEMAILDQAPHPNSAKLFINWLLTKEGMQALADAEKTPMERTDLDYSKIDPQDVPVAGRTYFDEANWDWNVGEKDTLIKQLLPMFGK